MKYDLEARTIVFAQEIVKLLKELPTTFINQRMITQLIGSSGSVAANYYEANQAESRRDFVHKITISKKEINEVKVWLKLLETAHPDKKAKITPLYNEAHELLLILSKIKSTTLKIRS